MHSIGITINKIPVTTSEQSTTIHIAPVQDPAVDRNNAEASCQTNVIHPSCQTQATNLKNQKPSLPVYVTVNDQELMGISKGQTDSSLTASVSGFNDQEAMSCEGPGTDPEVVKNLQETELSVELRHSIAMHCIYAMRNTSHMARVDESELIAWAKASRFTRNVIIHTKLFSLQKALHNYKSPNPTIHTTFSDLDINIEAYCWKFALSPYLKNYRVSWGPILVPAMREAGVDRLPSSDTGEDLDAIYCKIDENATKVLFKIQDVMFQSLQIFLDDKSMKPYCLTGWHVKTVARMLTAKISVAVTVELLQRLALLRDIYMGHLLDSEKGDFWTYVDCKLGKYSESYKDNPAGKEEWLQENLAMDVEDFPLDPNIDTVPYDKIFYAQRIVDKHVRQYLEF